MKRLLFLLISISISTLTFGQLSGSYTVGGSGGYFTSVVQAVDSLNRQGVNGAVVFNIRSGTYTGRLRINRPTGTSTTNTITFRPDTTNTTPVVIQYTGSSSNRSVLMFNGSQHISFDSLTIKSRGTSYSIVVEFMGAARYISVDGCKLEGYINATTGTYQTVVYDNSGSSNMSRDITIENNEIIGGSHSIYTYGSNTSSQQTGWKIINNNIYDWNYMGIRAQYTNLSVSKNKVSSKINGGYSYPYGVYLYYCYNTEVRGNNIQVEGSVYAQYGVYMYQCHATSSSRKYFANNIINVPKGRYGIYMNRNNYIDFVHNTIKTGTKYNATYTTYYYAGASNVVRNNIFYNSTGGYAFYRIGTAPTMSHNNYSSTGAKANFTLAGTDKTVDPVFNSLSDLHINSITLDGSGTNIAGITKDIDGDTRTSTRDMGADEFTARNHDLMPVKLILPGEGGCGEDSTQVTILVRNNGKLSQTSQPVTVIVISPIQDTITGTGTKTIASGKMDTVKVGKINTTIGGNFVFKLITNLSTEQRRENDTLLITKHRIYKSPRAPVVGNNIVVCNNIDTTLGANTNGKIVYWYEHPDSSYFHKGDSLTVNKTTRDTVWAKASDDYKSKVGIASNSVGFGNFYFRQNYGIKFDVLKTLTIDTVTVYQQSAGNVRVRLYSPIGTVLADSTYKVNSSGSAKLALGFKVLPGKGYKLDANGSTSQMWYTYSGVSYPYRDADSAIILTGDLLNNTRQYFFFYNWKISVEGCESPLVKVPINVRPSLKVNIGPDTGYCVGNTFNYTLNGTTSGGQSYLWQNRTTSPTYTVNNGGTYWVDVKSANGCVTRDSVVVSVVPIPVVTFLGGNVCTNTGALNINGKPTGGTIAGSGVIGGLYFPAVVGVGSHSLTYTFTDSIGCAASAVGTMVVDTAPKVTYTPPASICQNKRAVVLGGGSPAGGYYFGNNIQGSKLLPNKVGTTTINYVYYALNGCHDTASGTVNIIVSPNVTWASISDQCQNTPSFNLGATPGGGTYSGSGVSAGMFNARSAGVGLHKVSYVLTGANGCATLETKEIRVYPVPYISFASLISACEHEKNYLLVTGGPGGGTYSGNFVNSATRSFDVQSSGAGAHTIYYGRANQWCKDSIAQTLVVNATPKANFGSDKQICGKQTLTLDAKNTGGKFLWSTGDTSQMIIVSRPGHYAVTVTANDCRGVDSVKVSYSAICVGIDQRLEDKVSVNIFPNPSNGIINLNMTGFGNMDVEFLVHTTGGQKVFQANRSNLNETHEDKLDISNLADGIYLLNINTSEGSLVYRITINR
jgi:hypothetical protein|tara:strand:+ start:1113 stop:5009 length:3897 start_codon:yes stop_codon:yes gene_type:complete